ncbi:MAG: GNAT family N-acetyltransferase, partial [Actinomycetia bacterium]|nr:GNAT family N-acetyltransferase [Actinomycetes bacterium]
MAAPYPAHWEADVVLRDGGTAHLRPIRPDDADRLREFHSRLSPETIYYRFFAPYPTLSDRDVARFTQVDYEDRVAIVATVADDIIGVVRYDKVAEGEAEVAFTIRDDHQARGLGSVLLEHLAAAARERGMRRFVAEVLPTNVRMITVFREAGYEPHTSMEEGYLLMEFAIEPTEHSRAVMESREHRAEARSIERLLAPASVAVVGASGRPDSVGETLLRNLVESGFTGPVYAVNPRATGPIRGVPTVPDLSAIPGGV